MGKGRVIAGLAILGGSLAALYYFFRKRPPSEYGIFHGNIVNATTSMPIAGKPVYIGDHHGLSDGSGYFEVAVAPGTYTTLSVEGFMPYISSMTIETGQEIDLGTISLTPLITTGVFLGYISNAEAPGKRVNIDGYLSTNPIAANGYFEVAVAPGTYSALSVEGFMPYSLSMTIGAGQEIDLGTISLTLIPTEGCLQGYVLNKDTGAKIPYGSALIIIDGIHFIYNTVDELGGYRTPILEFGMHHFQVAANNFVTGEFNIEISQPVANYNFELEPLPEPPPGEWSDGVEVQEVTADPPIVYLGQTVQIKVYIQYGIDDPDSYPVPATIYGTVKINGQEIKDEFDIDYRNPTLGFPYTPPNIGVFTAVAQDKSTTFEVKPEVPGMYYSPYGEADPYTSKSEMIASWVNQRNSKPYAPSPADIFPPASYKGPIKDFTFWGEPYSDAKSTKCPICGQSLGDTTYDGIFADLFDHIEQAHPDYPWDMPKGGIVFARWKPGIPGIPGPPGQLSYDRWDLEGIILKPGHYTGSHTIHWIGIPEVVEYDVTVPDWGDRVYINIDTGEIAVVIWKELIGLIIP